MTDGGSWRLAGNGVDRHAAAFTGAFGPAALLLDFPGPSASAVGRLAMARLVRGERGDLEGAVPAYGREPDITRARPRS
jgi:hypothetical protein